METPSSNKLRPACPFYGFATGHYALIDSGGNQCPLIEGHAPCGRLADGQEPNWQECKLNVPSYEGSLEYYVRTARIFPEELRPRSEASWEGIPLQVWYDHITKGTPLFDDVPNAWPEG